MAAFLTVTLLIIFRGVFSAPNLILPSNVTLPENAIQSTLVAKMSATALPFDSIVGAPFIVNSNPVVHPFMIIPKGGNTWELILTSSPRLDFERVPLYTLQIIVEDSKGTSSTNTIVIEISKVNKAPVFTGTLAENDAEVYIAENTAVSAVIYRVGAKDPDNDVLQFSITPMNSGFEIDNTGAISTAATFDYESHIKSYTITVTISDGVLSDSANIKVYITNVNDNEPSLTCEFSNITKAGITKQRRTSGDTVAIELNEELRVGTAVITCAASDADLMNDLTFQLDPANSYFSIHKETGTVIIVSRMDSEEAGFVSVQSFGVKVCDGDLKCSSISTTVMVLPINDNPPYCAPYFYSFTKPEPITKDTVVAVLKCHDADIPPDVLTYQPNSGPLGVDKLFQQKPGDPHIIQANGDLDYDSDPVSSHQMMMSVFDSPDAPNTVTTTIVVSVTPVNDFDPVFDPPAYAFKVPETSGANYVIGKVSATDKDRPHCVRYRILNGNTDVINRFWVDPASGTLELLTQPDYESLPSYTLVVEASDCDLINPRKAQATVTFDIIEENDEAPECRPSRYTAIIYDNVTSGVNINNFRLNCRDRDSNDTSMRFEIVSGNINNHFAFDPTHGSRSPKLIVKTPFDFDNGVDVQQRYNLVVNIVDDNVKNGRVQKPRTGTVLISIRVVQTETPAPTNYYQRKGLTIVNKDVNTYDSSAWYVPFVFTLMALLLASLAAWVGYLLWKYSNLKGLCQKAKKRVKRYHAGTKKEKVEIFTETTTLEAVFDGEAIDPVTGNMYEYNTKSGARRWKTPQENVKLSDISTISDAMIPQPPSAPLMMAIGNN
ncbi:cadherin-related family member 3-like [Spea bombifrons]|uniref:cadherin-related family member 3-like n=1 Tax=Spea bombifrons TaxID=233779 RepID=UPI002349D235|nr:cadherin-related family member 3-like [Spea bombifrons]